MNEITYTYLKYTVLLFEQDGEHLFIVYHCHQLSIHVLLALVCWLSFQAVPPDCCLVIGTLYMQL